MSTSVIEALIVTLGLDPKQFNATAKATKKTQQDLADQSKKADSERVKRANDINNVERRNAKEDQQRGKDSAETYRRMRSDALAFLGVFTAGVGLKNFITNTIDNAANLGYLSQNLSMTTEQITAYQRASERAGGSANGMTAQLRESADTLAQLRAGFGPSEGLQNFFRFGGSSSDLKDGNTYLMARARIVSDMFKTDPARAALMAKQMGIVEDQFNLIKQGPAAIQVLVAAQEKNAAVSAKDAAAALDLRNKMLDLRDSLAATATRIVLQLAPSIERMFAQLESGAQWIADHKEDIARWVDTGTKAITAFTQQADKAAQAVGGWQNVLLALVGLRVASSVSSLVQMATALSGLGGALATVVGGAAAVPILIGLLGALSAYAGYKAAEFFFGDKTPKRPADRAEDQRPLERLPMAELRKRAAADRAAVGMEPFKYQKAPDNSQYVMGKLKSMGWTPEQAAGITGSFMQESGLDPNIVNPKSGARGIGQWLSKDRLENFRKFSGKDLADSTLDDQINFFQHEVTRGSERSAGNRLRATTTAAEAARVHSEAYERPGYGEANVPRRQRLAEELALPSRSQAAMAAASVPTGSTASLPPNVSHVSSSSSETRIDTININTQAMDADGIAKGIRSGLQRYEFATQANSGVQ